MPDVMGTARTPRVLVVPSSYFASDRTIGGGERYAHEYARALARVTPTTLGLFDLAPEVRSDGELEIRTFAVRAIRDRMLFPLTAGGARALASFDVVHVMVFPTPLSDLLVLLSRLRGQTLVLTDVGGGVPCLSTYLQRLHPRLGLARLAEGLALLSQHSAAQFSGWNQPRVVLYGGAEARNAAVPTGREEDAYALFVGRLLPHKGVLELIEATDAETPLRIVGRPYDPAYFEKLEAAAKGKKVAFHTAATDLELARHYAGARVVLQPSIPVHAGTQDTSELLGLVTLEGMAAGKPVIVTRAGSLPELVREGVTGFVVAPGDRVALGSRVRQLMQDATLAGSMGEAARIDAQERFTWDRVARRGLEFYERLRMSRTSRAG